MRICHTHKKTSKLVHVVVQKTSCITQKLVSPFSNFSTLVYFKDFTCFSYRNAHFVHVMSPTFSTFISVLILMCDSYIDSRGRVEIKRFFLYISL